jgi:uncharacterized protein (TIGR02145 family)
MILSFNRLIALIFLIAPFLPGCTPPDHQSPELKIAIAPPIGDSATVFYFNASATSDNSTPQWQIEVRWDFNNDNTWDTKYSIKKECSYRFSGNGIHTIACEAMDEAGNTIRETAEILVMQVLRDSQFIDSRDQKTYKAALLFDSWWMAENLMYGTPLTIDENTHDDLITEYYYLPDTLVYGGYYTWQEATLNGTDTAHGICPTGWRLPRADDIDALNEISSIGDQVENYLFGDGSLGTGFLCSGRFITSARVWNSQSEKTFFWLNNGANPNANKNLVYWNINNKTNGFMNLYMGNPDRAGTRVWNNDWGGFHYTKLAIPVRCVKDIQR